MSSRDQGTAQQTAQDINLLSNFLSNARISSLEAPITPITAARGSIPTVIKPSTVILIGSAILHQPTTVFTFFQTHCRDETSSPITTLVLTGGIGHSTTHLYSAILKHPIYSSLPSLVGRPDGDLSGYAEARLYYLIFIHFHDGENVIKSWNRGRGLKVVVEEESTNCGSNALLSRRELEANEIFIGDVNEGQEKTADVIIIQDPTMSIRTKASFEKVYKKAVRENARFWTWPVFVPSVVVDDEAGELVWDVENMKDVNHDMLWDMKRFYGLLMGEIPRIRDDENGYGPKGKGFITHIDIPSDVEDARSRLEKILDYRR